MRFHRRTQGRIPIKLAPTYWTMFIREDARWDGSSLVGLHHWLLEVNPQPLDMVTLVRNGKVIYKGSYHDLADEQTLW